MPECPWASLATLDAAWVLLEGTKSHRGCDDVLFLFLFLVLLFTLCAFMVACWALGALERGCWLSGCGAWASWLSRRSKFFGFRKLRIMLLFWSLEVCGLPVFEHGRVGARALS